MRKSLGSLSDFSSVTQATGHPVSSTHIRMVVVFPYPAGADTSVSKCPSWTPALNCLRTFFLGTRVRRKIGRLTLDTNKGSGIQISPGIYPSDCTISLCMVVRSKLETNRFRREKYLHWETTSKPDMVGARHCASYMRG